jgi:hypothetical protein
LNLLSVLLCDAYDLRLLNIVAVVGDMDHEVGICDAMLSMELGHPGVSFGTDKAGAGVSRDRDND